MHSSFVPIGHFHIPLSGIIAALGLIAALWLSQFTASRARLAPQAVWDAALTLILTAFLISRALLVAANLRVFLASPLRVLSLPSLNDTGILLTALVMVAYLRRRKLPLLGFLDALAPCATLVWAFLNLDSILDGTRDGMPRASGTSIQPIEAYTMIGALLLCGALLRILTHHRPRGHVFALALGLSGIAIFLLDFLRVPSELFAAAILDPVQWLGLTMLVVGCSLIIALPDIAATSSKSETRIGNSHAV